MMTEAQSRWHQFSTWVERIDHLPYFFAIRRGLALPLPLIMVGALALLLRYPPSDAMSRWLFAAFGSHAQAFADRLLAGTFGIGALVALTGFAVALTNLHNQRPGVSPVNPAIAASIVASCFFTLIFVDGDATPLASLSVAGGMWSALLAASLGGTLFLKLSGMRFLRIPLNHLSNDPVVGDVFTVMPAGMLTILIFAAGKFAWMSMAWPGYADTWGALPFTLSSKLSDNLLFGVVYEIASQVLWLFGIHGPNALFAVERYVLDPAGSANVAAVAHGGHAAFVFTHDFFSVFARMGGSGGTLSLILALLFVSRTVRSRKLALFIMLPALFNVNEPLLFGLPLVLNPLYAIPFILTPVVQILIGYAAIVFHVMPKTSYGVAWTTPALYSGYAVTGSLAGTFVQLLCLAAGAAIYAPFVRIAEYLAGKRSQETLTSLLRIAESPELSPKAMRYLDLPGEESRIAATLASDLDDAIKAGDQIFLEFQPQIDCRTGRVFGVEALLRWRHPFLGRVAPPITIMLADDIDQIDRLGLAILSLACRQRSAWRHVLPDDLVMAVNLSPRQLLDPDFHRKVLEILSREKLPSSLLELEITESTILLPHANAIDNLKQLRAAGVKVAMDDFGMGHTSLHYLREMPLDTVKIDRSLADVTAGSVNEHIVRSIADLSRTLHLSLVVEGVENEPQLKRLSALGCERFQGYFFSRPLAAGDCLEFILDARRQHAFTV
ncbi:EAL domain-containing protein [Trinickia sp.]|uniref:EAL domain-containing protein n=1 Tax=Trinickia sp. TaxID=2571163 RepID=UPI003F7F742A